MNIVGAGCEEENQDDASGPCCGWYATSTRSTPNSRTAKITAKTTRCFPVSFHAGPSKYVPPTATTHARNRRMIARVILMTPAVVSEASTNATTVAVTNAAAASAAKRGRSGSGGSLAGGV